MKALSLEIMIPFSNPNKMQNDLQNATNIEYNVRHGKYLGRSYISLFNFFTAQSIDTYEGEVLKVTICEDTKGIKHYQLEKY